MVKLREEKNVLEKTGKREKQGQESLQQKKGSETRSCSETRGEECNQATGGKTKREREKKEIPRGNWGKAAGGNNQKAMSCRGDNGTHGHLV